MRIASAHSDPVLAAGHSRRLRTHTRLLLLLRLPLLLLLHTCELIFSLVGSTVRPVAAQAGTCRTAGDSQPCFWLCIRSASS